MLQGIYCTCTAEFIEVWHSLKMLSIFQTPFDFADKHQYFGLHSFFHESASFSKICVEGNTKSFLIVLLSGTYIGARPDIPNLPPCTSSEAAAVDAFIPSKIILTGQKKKTFHREELTQSETEKRIKIKTEHHAAVTQHRQTKLQKSPVKSPPKQQQV